MKSALAAGFDLLVGGEVTSLLRFSVAGVPFIIVDSLSGCTSASILGLPALLLLLLTISDVDSVVAAPGSAADDPAAGGGDGEDCSVFWVANVSLPSIILIGKKKERVSDSQLEE